MDTPDHEIKLHELPESKMFMKTTRFADNYSKRKHVMSGFKFCSEDDDIKFGKFCVGDRNRVSIRGDKICDSLQHISYAYTDGDTSEHDISSLVNLANNANKSNEPRISCTKSTGSKDILCLRVEHITDGMMNNINRIGDQFKRGIITNIDASDMLYTILNPDMIQIDARTRNVIMSVLDGETEYYEK